MHATASGSVGDRPLISWYGDDLTGAAAVLEVLAAAGLRSILFMGIPTADEIEPYAEWPGIGIAGTARHRDVRWMDRYLPQVFEFLASLSAPIAHYKVCSTLDSSPEVGSIGRAVELALPFLGGEWTPLLVGAPPIGRYQSFGNLFAEAAGVVYRLDRHPTMSRHPVTPMHEADVRKHLASQTAMQIGLIDSLSLNSGLAHEALRREIDAGACAVSLDVADDATLLAIGELIWQNRGDRILAVGSQGVEYALVRYWQEIGLLEGPARTPELEPAERFAAVSASVSPTTASQIEWAGRNGFELIRLEVGEALEASKWASEVDRACDRALACLDDGGSPILYTALGPDDPSVSALSAALARQDRSPRDVSEQIGTGLGQILTRLVHQGRITRCAVVGGDTSGHVTRALGVRSLTFLARVGHGTSVMSANVGPRGTRSLEYSLKGGQMGSVDFFGAAKNLHSSS